MLRHELQYFCAINMPVRQSALGMRGFNQAKCACFAVKLNRVNFKSLENKPDSSENRLISLAFYWIVRVDSSMPTLSQIINANCVRFVTDAIGRARE